MENTIFKEISEEVDRFQLYIGEYILGPMRSVMIKQGVTLYTLTVFHHKILNQLNIRFRGQWVSMKILASHAQSDRGHLSRAIYELEKMGLIEIRSDEKDRRAKHVRLTEKGEQVCDEGNSRSAALFEQYYSKYLSDSEIEDIHNCLSKVNVHLQKLQPKEFFWGETDVPAWRKIRD